MKGLVIFVLASWASVAAAVQPGEQLPDPALEARAREISAGLRCLVCQNQSIDDSHAPLARDLRLLVRQRLDAGDSDAEVRNFLVARYGDFILLKPPFGVSTLLLWLTPLLVLGIGAFVVARRFRVARPKPEEALSDAEEDAFSRLLSEGE